MAFRSIPSKALTGLPRTVPMNLGSSKPAQLIAAHICGRYSSTNATITGDALHEYFAVIWNKKDAGTLAAKPETLKFADDQVQVTFFGEMETLSGSGQSGICFACQAPSEERVRNAILEHESKVKGIWDTDKIEVSALETVHTSDFGKM